MLAVWSLRIFIITAGAWLIVGTVYFARPSNPLLPAPLNVLLFVTLASLATGALATWFGSSILGRLTAQTAALADQKAALERMVDVVNSGHARHLFETARLRGEVSQLRELIEQTMDLGRPPLAVAGEYDAGYADGLARHPMREAKVFQISPRDSGS